MTALMCQMQEFTKCPTVFFNIKHLVLTIEMFRHHDEHTGGIIRLAYLLELAPVLEELELHVSYLFSNILFMVPLKFLLYIPS